MATTGNNPRGLVASRTLDGRPPNAGGRLYPTGARNARQIFKGDPVFVDANGEIQVWTNVSAAAQAPVGVVAAVYNDDRRPLTHNLPATGHFISASTSAHVAVYDDPDIVFVAQADASLPPTAIGQFVSVTANAPTTAAGQSGFVIRTAEITGTAVGHPFKIIGLAPMELDRVPAANNDVEIIISNHLWRASRAKQIGTAV